MYFFPKLAAFNIRWCSHPEKKIQSYIPPKGYLTKPGMDNQDGSHKKFYEEFLNSLKP
tara:strand:- start:66 stop:239 length:174 start_codon:yes stop_codon:yes gene_type:complete